MLIFGLSVQERRQKMKKNPIKKQDDDDLKEEYDLSKMAILPKGRFDPKRRIGTNVVVLEPEIAKALIAGGRDASTPVAAVRWGTRLSRARGKRRLSSYGGLANLCAQ